MNVVGIIAEYNPFHNGHKFHIEKAKELSGADYAVIIMSGNFVQRGEPACASKWTRTKCALLNGADLVLELPTVYASQSAEYFAHGAVSILNSLNCITHLAFGSETDDIETLSQVATFLISDTFNKEITSFEEKNISFPSARDSILENHGYLNILKTPNNILAVEYIKQLILLNSQIKPIAIKRVGAEHDKVGNDFITSASHIRALELDKAKQFVPENVFEILNNENQINKKVFEDIIMLKLRTMSKDDLSEIAEVYEGLENRIKDCAIKASNLTEVINLIKTKRYTHSRIRRIMINILLGIKKSDLKKEPEYARILGMNENGKTLLKEIKKEREIPLITKIDKNNVGRMLELDITSTDVYSYLYTDENNKKGGKDFLISPIII